MMRPCILVFLVWWTVFVCAVWHETYKPKRRWYLHTTPQRIHKSIQIRPLKFKHTNLTWISILEDKIDLNLSVSVPKALATPSVASMSMDVFECENCTKVSEVYDIPFNASAPIENSTWSFFQNDVHLSPFRRLNVVPVLDWMVGNVEGRVPKSRPGKFINDIWEEGQDITISIGLTFLAWGMGLAFLIITRKKSGRNVRIVFNRPSVNIKTTEKKETSKVTFKM